MRVLASLLLLLLTASAGAQPSLELENTSLGVEVRLPWTGGRLWRGYQPIREEDNSNTVEFKPQGNRLLDSLVPDGVRLYYAAEHPDGRLETAEIVRPRKRLPTLLYPRIQVDKLSYILSVLEGDEVVKRYPISLGGNPTNRKFCYDRLSTPEGLYRIINLQPRATFYRAYDIDYPNEVDELRHRLSREAGLIEKSRPIGGEIQIHGDGIQGNWTHGCMGLRNQDMDELFSKSQLDEGVEVFITGSQIKAEDRLWLIIPPWDYVAQVQERLNTEGFRVGEANGTFNEATSIALGRFQRVNGLPISCQLDSATREFLLRQFQLRW